MDIGEKLREYIASLAQATPLTQDVADAKAADAVEPSTDTVKNMAKGGKVLDPKDIIGLPGVPAPKPMNPVVAAGLPGVPALPGVAAPVSKTPPPDMRSEEQKELDGDAGPDMNKGGVAASNENAPHKAPEGPSEEEKRELVMKALKENALHLANGATVPDPDDTDTPTSATGDVDNPTLDPNAPQESKLQTILQALGMAARTGINAVTNPVDAITQAIVHSPAATPIANTALQGAGILTGTNPPTLTDAAPAPSASPAAVPTPPMPVATTPAKPAPVAASPSPSATPAPDPLAQLGKFDPSTVAPGLNPNDRQALATQLNGSQHTMGNYLAEALAGLGDALAAKGGVQQSSLNNIFALQKQQRDEALANFDKAREIAVQNRAMKTQADQALIDNVKAKNELGPLPTGITSAMGLPPGTTPTQANLIIGMNNARIEHQDKAAQLQLESAKQASDEWEKLPVTQRLLGGASNQTSWIANRTNDLMQKAMGNIKVTDGKNVGYVSPQDYQHAKSKGANIQQVPF